MNSENELVAAALEKHEKDKQSKNLIMSDINEVYYFKGVIYLCFS